jgi:hypothetical protein
MGRIRGAVSGGAIWLQRHFGDREIWLYFLASRLVFLAGYTLTSAVAAGLPGDREIFAYPAAQWLSLVHDALFTADSGWYRTIVQGGYDRVPFDQVFRANWVFFPLYPWSIRLLGGSDWAGIVLSNVLAIPAFSLTRELVTRLRGPDAGSRAVALLAFFPTSYVFSSYRPESLFLLLAVGTYLAALERRFWLAGALGFLATLTRLPGLLLSFVILWEAWRAQGRTLRVRPAFFAAGLPVLALALFTIYEWSISGHPMAWSAMQNKGWGRSLQAPSFLYEILIRAPRLIAYSGWDFTPVNIAVLAASIAAICWLVMQGFGALAVYTAGTLAMPLMTGTTTGLARYAMVSFGLFVAWAGPAKRADVFAAALGVCAALLGAFGVWMGMGSTVVIG